MFNRLERMQQLFPILLHRRINAWNLNVSSVAGFLLILFALAYTVIRAQISNSGISVYPTNFDITAIPGQKASGVITVDNLTAQPIQIRVDWEISLL